jgi:hypothetical protein
MRASAGFIFLFLVVAACGARTPLDLADISGGDDDASAPPGVDAAAPDSDRPPKAPTHVGYVGAIGAGMESASAVARFYPDVVDPACAYVGAVGTCSIVTCFSGSDAPASDDAGLITAVSNGDTAFLLYSGVSPTGTYQTATFADGTRITQGSMIEFLGGGAADVPTFDVSVSIPGFGTLTSPVLQVSATIETSLDLPLEWEPIPFADAVFALSPPTSTDTTPTLVCFFDGASGAGVVPHAMLAAIKQASPNDEAEMSFLAMARSSTTAGDWTVNAIAITGIGSTQQTGTITLE